MAPKSWTWTVEEDNDGSIDVSLGGRRKFTTDDMGRAETYVRARFIPGQKVVQVEPDGYRTDITKDFARRS